MSNQIQHGDRITAYGVTFTVEKILYQEYWGDRKDERPRSDFWGYDCEFIDTDGQYHHWEQNLDCGTAARWNGRCWAPYNENGFPVQEGR